MVSVEGVYVISLASHWETRGAKTVQYLQDNAPPAVEGSGNVQRFDATTPVDFDLQKVTTPWAHAIIKGESERVTHADLSNAPQVACYLSHRALWKKCDELGQPIVVVEDDERPCNWTARLLQIKDVPGAELVLLQCSKFKSRKASDGAVARVRTFDGAGSYYLSPAGARRLLAKCFPVAAHVDQYMSKCVDTYNMPCYAVKNASLQVYRESTLNHPSVWSIVTERQSYQIQILACSLAIAIVMVIVCAVGWAKATALA